MPERMLTRDDIMAERPISFSELGCVALDLETIGDAEAKDNARIALLRASAGIPEHEAWMRDEPAGSMWDNEVARIRELLEK